MWVNAFASATPVSSSSRDLCFPAAARPLYVMVAAPPASRTRSSAPALRSFSPAVSRTALSSNTRRLCRRKPAPRSRRRAAAASSTLSLISVSVAGFAFMVVQEIPVDRLAPAKALVDAMPEANRVLAELPAKIDLDAAKQGREVDQPDIQVLDDAAGLLHGFHRRLQPRRCGIAALPHRQRALPVHHHAAHHHEPLLQRLEGPARLFQFVLQPDGFPQQRIQPRQQLLGFDEGEALRHQAWGAASIMPAAGAASSAA